MKKIIDEIKRFAIKNCNNVYAVGGYIRDKLINNKNKYEDIDIIYDGNIENLINYLKVKKYKVICINKNIKIYRVYNDGIVLDICSLKGDSLKQDLEKRDYTINAIALDLCSNKIVDPFQGRKHILNRTIHYVNKDSIKEDRVRILRGVRLAIKYDMHFSVDTEVCIRTEAKFISNCTKERIFDELMKIIKADTFGNAFEMLDTYGILKDLLPYIEQLKTIGKCKYHIEDVFTHMNTTYKVFKDLSNFKFNLKGLNYDKFNIQIGNYKLQDYLAFSAFVHDIGKYECYKKQGKKVSFINHDKVGSMIMNSFCKFWRFPRDAKNIVVKVVEGHMYPLILFKNNVKNYRDSFYKFFVKYDKFVTYILTISFCDVYATELFLDMNNEKEKYKEYIEKIFKEYEIYKNIKDNRLLKGNEVIQLIGKEGRIVSEILDEIDYLRYKGRITTAQEAIDFIMKTYIT
ncbi:CCA tRNA nucleotidyltransferase [Haloimpatiens sp. FM7330]|uniref:CCA tRNA nucleotidyltransferase n=1 Tax=Haloimpatiens sp. FM7330 TaxID=3298610 RepID=UPI003635AF2A